MCRAFRFAMLLSAMLVPMLALGQGGQPAKIDPAKIRANLLMKNTYIDGKFTSINEEEKTFSFQYTYLIRKPNPQGQAKLGEISRKFNMALAMRNTSLDTLKAM